MGLKKADVEVAVRCYLPSEIRDYVLASLNELDKLRTGENWHNSILTARQTRTKKIESQIAYWYEQYRTDLEALPLSRRAKTLRKRMQYAKTRGDIKCVPTLVLVRRVCYRLAEAQKTGIAPFC